MGRTGTDGTGRRKMGTSQKERKILIIDDERSNIAFLMNLLKGDYKVVAALDGHKGLAMAAATGAQRPDLILLDVLMPGMDGYEVCERLKSDERTRHIPVIFVTAATDVADETRGFELGAVDYIAKPFHPPVVKARVRTHVELKVKSDLLDQLASVDGLMNIYNRRRFDEVLELEWGRAERSGTSLSLIMIDIDHFKRFNDRYGHAEGDLCLKEVAAALKGCVKRPTDLLARYGGEELVVLLPDTDAQGAGMLAETMREAVEALGIRHEDSSVGDEVTISVGVGCINWPWPVGTPMALVELADEMLYQSKGAGRNIVSLASRGAGARAAVEVVG